MPIISFGKILDEDINNITDQKLIELITYALNFLINNYNHLEVRWGSINKLIRGNKVLELSGGPDISRAIYTKETDKGLLQATSGDCYILIAIWDKNGKVHSEIIHQYGSATTNENSIHYNDQANLFSKNELKNVSIYLDEILLDFKNIQILK